MAPTPDDAALLAARRTRIMEAMGGGVLLLAAAPERVRTGDVLYPFRQDSDFDYVTGFPEPDAVAVLGPRAPCSSTARMRRIRSTISRRCCSPSSRRRRTSTTRSSATIRSPD